MEALVAIVVILIIVYMLSQRENFTAAILKSDYPRLIYNVPPYLPTGSTLGLKYAQPTPSQWPPYLTQGQYNMPATSYVVAPIDWTINP